MDSDDDQNAYTGALQLQRRNRDVWGFDAADLASDEDLDPEDAGPQRQYPESSPAPMRTSFSCFWPWILAVALQAVVVAWHVLMHPAIVILPATTTQQSITITRSIRPLPLYHDIVEAYLYAVKLELAGIAGHLPCDGSIDLGPSWESSAPRAVRTTNTKVIDKLLTAIVGVEQRMGWKDCSMEDCGNFNVTMQAVQYVLARFHHVYYLDSTLDGRWAFDDVVFVLRTAGLQVPSWNWSSERDDWIQPPGEEELKEWLTTPPSATLQTGSKYLLDLSDVVLRMAPWTQPHTFGCGFCDSSPWSPPIFTDAKPGATLLGDDPLEDIFHGEDHQDFTEEDKEDIIGGLRLWYNWNADDLDQDDLWDDMGIAKPHMGGHFICDEAFRALLDSKTRKIDPQAAANHIKDWVARREVMREAYHEVDARGIPLYVSPMDDEEMRKEKLPREPRRAAYARQLAELIAVLRKAIALLDKLPRPPYAFKSHDWLPEPTGLYKLLPEDLYREIMEQSNEDIIDGWLKHQRRAAAYENDLRLRDNVDELRALLGPLEKFLREQAWIAAVAESHLCPTYRKLRREVELLQLGHTWYRRFHLPSQQVHNRSQDAQTVRLAEYRANVSVLNEAFGIDWLARWVTLSPNLTKFHPIVSNNSTPLLVQIEEARMVLPSPETFIKEMKDGVNQIESLSINVIGTNFWGRS